MNESTLVSAADNAFDGWKEYEEICALMWRKGTGHGGFHSFDVKVVDRDHPVTRDFPDMVAHRSRSRSADRSASR